MNIMHNRKTDILNKAIFIMNADETNAQGDYPLIIRTSKGNVTADGKYTNGHARQFFTKFVSEVLGVTIKELNRSYRITCEYIDGYGYMARMKTR